MCRKNRTLYLLGLIVTFLIFSIFTIAHSQLPIKPQEPAVKLPPPPLSPAPQLPIKPTYGDRCKYDVEIVLPVVIRYHGRHTEETITLNPNQRAGIQIPETFLDGRGRVPIKVIFKLKNKTNKWFRPFPVFITYDGRQSGGQTVSFAPWEEKNIELNIWVYPTGGRYQSFVIGAPRDECGQDDANVSFFYANFGIYVIIL